MRKRENGKRVKNEIGKKVNSDYGPPPYDSFKRRVQSYL